ncbi:MAG: hypothetical protein Ta2E_08420 [Mycoplasmoidaceae bacterium]|nr:MAG: hypothetical protein Ta2E_08420 [Mycoplasmoidaceae bacterium]
MWVCRLLINWQWYCYNYSWWHPIKLASFKYRRFFQPISVKFRNQRLNRWYSFSIFIFSLVLGTLLIALRLIFFSNIDHELWIGVIILYIFGLPSLFIFSCSTFNKNYKLYLKTLKYLDTLKDTKLITYEINKMYYESKMLNETQWQLHKFWYIYQKDIPWEKKDCVIVGTRKDLSDKPYYQSDIAELVKDL